MTFIQAIKALEAELELTPLETQGGCHVELLIDERFRVILSSYCQRDLLMSAQVHTLEHMDELSENEWRRLLRLSRALIKVSPCSLSWDEESRSLHLEDCVLLENCDGPQLRARLQDFTNSLEFWTKNTEKRRTKTAASADTSFLFP